MCSSFSVGTTGERRDFFYGFVGDFSETTCRALVSCPVSLYTHAVGIKLVTFWLCDSLSQPSLLLLGWQAAHLTDILFGFLDTEPIVWLRSPRSC